MRNSKITRKTSRRSTSKGYVMLETGLIFLVFAAMLIGAFAGAAALLHAGPAATLLIGSVAVLAAGLGFWAAKESRRLDRPAG